MSVTRAALITGGSRGIGAEIARRLAEEGFALTLAARGAEALEETARRLRADTGAEVQTVPARMNDPERIAALTAAHDERFGRLDLLVSSAGTGTAGPVADLPAATYERMMEVNLRGPLLLIQRALPLLRRTARRDPARGARIVALASMTGVAGEAGLAAYGASKAALISLCETVSLEESGNGVNVTALSPGYVDTDMSAWKHGDVPPEAMITTGDIAELVLALSRLSANAVVPNIVVSRAGDRLWRA
ncbi:SDR family NAD(P)-dependent oxidoreductase [Nocardia thailandica]|uniref:SDR family NAD(P)-dependent oxidoreductase n=1 Tax=Nocardia thailandica TaxID=257275 RepID=UPI0003067A92|nr:SDR family oxidoreductase [Nocardia thailandica]